MDEKDEIKEIEDISEINLNYEIQKDNKLNSNENRDISNINIKNSSGWILRIYLSVLRLKKLLAKNKEIFVKI